jgi:predicted GNAT superfamily acetyltransferase
VTRATREAGVIARCESSDGVVVRSVTTDEMSACQALYVKVMHLQPGDGGINGRLLSAIQANGGLVLGAFADDELIGFTYSFIGRDPGSSAGEVYQYSQLAVVAPEWQGHGVGRRLKYAQRDACLDLGIARMRWAFDPMKTRNGHFNLSVLGARVIRFVPAMYGERGFGEDSAHSTTDRFVVQWDLDQRSTAREFTLSEPVARTAGFAATLRRENDVLVTVPSDWASLRAEYEWPQAERLMREFRTVFADILSTGRIGVRCDIVTEGIAAYQFVTPTKMHAGGRS